MSARAEQAITVAVCVITYRRPEGLHRLLTSLEGLHLADADVGLRFIVVDNDPAGSARAIVDGAARVSPWPITYEVESRKGVVYPRNRAVALAAGCEYVAFVDDDEIVEPDWLGALLRAARTYDADLVVGPVLPIFEATPPRWIVQSGLFDPPQRPATGDPPTYVGAGNLLLARRAITRLRGPFDPRFTLTGGEDSFLHIELREAGARLVWCDEAVAHEFVPPRRMTVRWMLARAYRNGNVVARCERAYHGQRHGGIASAGRGALRLSLGLVGLVPSIFRGRARVVRQVGMMARGAGRIVGAFGRNVEGYRAEIAG